MRNIVKVRTLLLITIISLGLIIYCLLAYKKDSQLLESTINNREKTNNLAIMITNENGLGFKEYTNSDWPSEPYAYSAGNIVTNGITFNNDTKDLTIKTTKAVRCFLYFEKPLISYLRKNDTKGVLSSEIAGGMYRYQGLDKKYKNDDVNNKDNLPIVDNNYICFGTDDVSKCNCNTEENCDKYMYRIIGITNDEHLKLLKDSLLEENETIITPAWHSKTYLSKPYDGSSGDCDEDKCEWPNGMLYKRLNGISNGTAPNAEGWAGHVSANTDLFVDSVQYDYLKSGDKVNGSDTASKWYNLIEKYEWMYGDTLDSASYNGDTLYAIETGQQSTRRYWRKLGEEAISVVPYFFEKKVNAKIGLMYVHDYFYAYPGGNPGNANNAFKSWIHYTYNEYYPFSDMTAEYLINRPGLTYADAAIVGALTIGWTGKIESHFVNNGDKWQPSVRPVFYLTNNIKLSGTGTIDNPYFISQN